MGTSFCDVKTTLKRQEENGNIFFLKQDAFSTRKCMFFTLLPKNAHGITQRPTLSGMTLGYIDS